MKNQIDNDIRILKGKQGEIMSRGKIIDKKLENLYVGLVRSDEDKAELVQVRGELNAKKSEKRLSLNKVREEKRISVNEAKAKAHTKKNIITRLFRSKKVKK